MTVKIFADTNIAGYLIAHEGDKRDQAKAIFRDRPTISAQVVNEFINVCRKKARLELPVAYELAEGLIATSQVVPVTVETVVSAMTIARRYRFSHWDSLIIAAAVQANCDILYSEDMQHGQTIEGLRIINPFLTPAASPIQTPA